MDKASINFRIKNRKPNTRRINLLLNVAEASSKPRKIQRKKGG